MTLVTFYVLAAIAVVAGLAMITRRNPLSSALSLVVAMAALAGIYATLHAQALATIQILVYAGAITVLILFVLMVVDLDDAGLEQQRARPRGLVAGGLVGAALAVTLSVVMLNVAPVDPARVPDALGSMQAAGHVLLGQPSVADAPASAFVPGPLLFAFEVVSLLLLVAMTAAVVLAKRRV